jgi:hypothetical protein
LIRCCGSAVATYENRLLSSLSYYYLRSTCHKTVTMALCFVIHSLDAEPTCWFSHFFESLIIDKKDDQNRNKTKVLTLMQRVYRDYKVCTSTVEYHNESSFEGCMLVNIDDEDLFVVYKQVQEYVTNM